MNLILSLNPVYEDENLNFKTKKGEWMGGK